MTQIKPGMSQDFEIEPNHEPLYKRLPSRDENGRYLSDFMMLIPGMKNRSGRDFQSRLDHIHALLEGQEDVVFADLNVPLNLLWVSIKTRHGLINELAAEIRRRIPEARLVGHPVFESPAANGGRDLIRPLATRVLSRCFNGSWLTFV